MCLSYMLCLSFASLMCCGGRPAEPLCALHYMGSGARPYLYPVTDSPIIIPTIIVIIPTIVVTWKHRKSYFEIRRSWGSWVHSDL